MFSYRNIISCSMVCLMHFQSNAQIKEGATFYLKECLQKLRAQFNVPAVCGTLVIDGEIVAYAATGIRKTGNNAKVTNEDLFAVGSVTKTITGFVSAKIIQDNPGLISWTTSIKDLYPELVGLPGVSNAGLNSTIQDLNRFRVQVTTACVSHASCNLNQFSGVSAGCCQAGITGLPENCSKNNLDNYLVCGRNEFVHKMMKLAVAPIAGGVFPYNNNTPVLVSAMLQRVKNTTYEKLLKQNFFQALSMPKAKLISQVTDTEADMVQLPFGHDNNNSNPSGYFKSDNNRFHVCHASGGVMMTPEEMGIYLIELMPGAPGRKKLLTDANLANYFTGFTVMNPKAIGGWFSVTVNQKVNDPGIQKDSAFWHNGGLEGFKSDFLLIPSKQFGFACVTTGNVAIQEKLKVQLVNMWYQKDFLQYVPIPNNATLSNAKPMEPLTDNDFLTTSVSAVTNDAIIAKAAPLSPFRYVMLAYPRDNNNIDKIQIFAKGADNVEYELSSSLPGQDNTAFLFDDNVFAKELRIQFTNSNNKKTILSEVKVVATTFDRVRIDPIEKIMDPIKKIVDPVVRKRMNIVSVKVPQQLQQGAKKIN